MFNAWTGDYSSAVRELAFILRIDGESHSYTEMWSICAAQKAKRKRDWIEVEIGIPERWWRLAHSGGYKKRPAREVEGAFVFRREHRPVTVSPAIRPMGWLSPRWPISS
jgi:hypothetical protein